MFASMKPVLIALDATRYARALSHLRRAIRCYHGLDDALVAASTSTNDDPNVRRAFDLLLALDAALYGATRDRETAHRTASRDSTSLVKAPSCRVQRLRGEPKYVAGMTEPCSTIVLEALALSRGRPHGRGGGARAARRGPRAGPGRVHRAGA